MMKNEKGGSIPRHSFPHARASYKQRTLRGRKTYKESPEMIREGTHAARCACIIAVALYVVWVLAVSVQRSAFCFSRGGGREMHFFLCDERETTRVWRVIHPTYITSFAHFMTTCDTRRPSLAGNRCVGQPPRPPRPVARRISPGQGASG